MRLSQSIPFTPVPLKGKLSEKCFASKTIAVAVLQHGAIKAYISAGRWEVLCDHHLEVT